MRRMTRLAVVLALAAACNKPAPAPETNTPPAPPAIEEEGEPDPMPTTTALYDIPVHTLQGEPTTLGAFRGKTILAVNVASECGLTPQYEQLQAVHDKYAARGFTVVGFPCNQFGGQEPGTAEEIATFCSKNYGVTFPLMEKIEVNGPGRHPIYQQLTAVPDAVGEAGDIQWNFEKFVISADGTTITRFRPRTTPDAPEVIAAIEAGLPE